MGKKKENQGCCPDTHAKCFEILLIIGFLFSIIILTINLILNIWLFKLSILLLVFAIVPIGLNAISFISSIILRLWRSDGSVLKKNSSPSSSVAGFLLFLVIINLLSSIAEEVLYSFIYNYYHVGEELHKCIKNHCSDYEKLDKKLEKLEKIYLKLLNKYKEHEDNFKFKDEKDEEKKMKIFKLLPWIAFNFNNFIQFLSFIFVIILLGRIKIKNHFGFPKIDNQSSKNKILDIKKKLSLKKNKKGKKGDKVSNVESEVTNLKNKKKKKKTKKRNFLKKNKH